MVAKLAALERQGSAKDALHNAALSNHVATISNLENRLATALEKVESVRSELEKEHASRLEREGAAHEEALTKAVTTIESKERIINQLSENNERRDVEVASLKTHTDEQNKRVDVLTEQLRKAEEATASAKAHAKAAQASVKAQKALRQPPPEVKTRSVRVSTQNASTSTHQCASTQTDPEPKPSSTPAVGEKVIVESTPKPTCSYQTAIDVLQQLVVMSGNAPQPQMMVPAHPPQHGYPRPLPFPHFTPGHVAPYAFDAHGHPQFTPNYHNGRY
jgi:chromosome segregation ATPase